jgi:hypothetical protein
VSRFERQTSQALPLLQLDKRIVVHLATVPAADGLIARSAAL